MKRLLFFSLVLAGIALVSEPVLDACGSKFLVGSKAARYQRMRAVSPANVLVYYKQDATTAAEDRWNPEFESTLEQVGYSIEVATDASSFQEAVRGRDFDIVMMGLGDARNLRSDISSLSPHAVLLPVVSFPTRAELSQAKREFGNVLKTPTTMKRLLSVMEKSRKDRK